VQGRARPQKKGTQPSSKRVHRTEEEVILRRIAKANRRIMRSIDHEQIKFEGAVVLRLADRLDELRMRDTVTA
jgi:hypothetical protein